MKIFFVREKSTFEPANLLQKPTRQVIVIPAYTEIRISPTDHQNLEVWANIRLRKIEKFQSWILSQRLKIKIVDLFGNFLFLPRFAINKKFQRDFRHHLLMNECFQNKCKFNYVKVTSYPLPLSIFNTC